MSPRVKKTLIIVSVVLGVLTLMCGVLGGWAYSNASEWAAGQRVQGQQTIAEAEQFAAGHDRVGCLDEGLRRDDACAPSGVMCLAHVGVFTEHCLDTAASVPGFCDDVPPQTEIMQSAQWAVDRCVSLGRAGNQPCAQLMQTVQRSCLRRP